MKTLITLLVTLFISISSVAQQGINYKAILKDGSGNLLAGTFMNVQFTIHEASASGTIVYQEDHNYTTDANGLLILNIGSDLSPSIGVFNDIDWGVDKHFLQITINYSGGTINFDATEFMAVPYAKYAASGWTGLEKITEGSNTGWRLLESDANNYGNIGGNAVDLSISDISANHGATGNGSFAANYRTLAQGNSSSAFGISTIATGANSMALGQFNVDDPNAIFLIGNGVGDADRKNAMVVKSNGDFIVGSSQMDNDPAIADDDSRMFFNKTKSAFRAG
ncbi:MAG: hypothetical protein HKO72_06565, partial [Flavobacteriaceae bacterium]|nr:hypothetical protein [Bacteroidia bacterium]NNL60985.1 hypothetical protein [Flavobacteriaceae bacterium]